MLLLIWVLTQAHARVSRLLPAPQDKAPVHSFAHTKREVEAAFGAPLLTRFSWFDPKPLASGSIAQVCKGSLS